MLNENTLPFKSLGSKVDFKMFLKENFYAHQGCIYLITIQQ